MMNGQKNKGKNQRNNLLQVNSRIEIYQVTKQSTICEKKLHLLQPKHHWIHSITNNYTHSNIYSTVLTRFNNS